MPKRALITAISGQDGSSLAEPLLRKGHELAEGSRLVTPLSSIAPDEVRHFGAQRHVRVRFDEPACAGDTTGMGTTRLLKASETARIMVEPDIKALHS